MGSFIIEVYNGGNLKNMKSAFVQCSRVTSFPDLSKWNTKNVENMSYVL